MRLLKFVSLLLPFLIIVSTASALSPITIEVNESKDTIRSDESANFILYITNNQEFKDEFYVSTPRSNWDMAFEDYYILINSKSVANTKLRASPPINAPPGKYALYLEVKSASNPKVVEYRYLHVYITDSIKLIEPEPEQPITELTVIEEESTDTWLKHSYTVLLNNTGETNIEDAWTDTFTELELFLLSSEPEYSMILDYGKNKKVAWAYSLAPGDTLRISYSVSFVPLLVAGILVSGSLILFGFYYNSSFKLRKSVISSRKKGHRSLKVEIIVCNKTGRPQKNVIVEDYVPVPFNVLKKFSTIEPDLISKSGNYVKLKWKFPELAPKDERVLSYELQSKIRVIGSVTLPQAILTQKIGGKERQAFSGVINIIGK